jgi:dipeptidyl aminopeptidase/acylaminoacyl peptidase
MSKEMKKHRRDSLDRCTLTLGLRANYSAIPRFNMAKFFVICLLLGLSAGAGSALAEKRNITEKDLFDFVWIGDPQVSPDGSRVAFVRVTVNEKKDGYNTSIWTVPLAGGEEPHQLTKGNHDSTPRWSPDGKFLLFLRASEKDGKPEPPQLALLPTAGGDSFVFTDLPKGAGNPSWAPDGKTIAFNSDTNAEDLAKQEKKKAKEEEAKKAGSGNAPASADERESDVRVITRAVYRQDNEGYGDPKHPSHIWLVNAPRSADEKVKPRQLTKGRFDEDSATWSRDGSQIYFTSDRNDEPYYDLPKTDLYSVAAAGGEPVKITTIDLQIGGFGPGGGALSLSPDGKQVAFTASTTRPIASYTQPDLWVLDLSPNAKPRNLTANFDFDVPGFVIGDGAPPRAGGQNKPIWTPEGKGLIAVYTKEGKANLALFDLPVAQDADLGRTGVHDLTSGNQGVMSFRALPDGSKLIYVVSTPTRINDLFVLDRTTSDATPKQLTHVNDELFSKLNLTEPEEIWYDSFDGKHIEGWVQKPPNFDSHKRYPLILNIHGGPHVAYGYVFDHEFQWMAAKGYVVLYPNPRGSTTYGQEFGNIIQYPGDDYKDLMAGVDELIKFGYVDDKKLGVTGGSGGGLLTNWVVGQTNRFAAAVAQRDIASWEDWWYTGDFTLFQPNWFKVPPFEDPQEYRARSPINFIKNVTTPMMFILGEADYRTPPGSGGEQMFRALKFRKIPAVMVRFPNESHELSRSGQPWHRVERLQHIVGWFDHWLMGAPKPEYEIVPPEDAPAKKGSMLAK